MDGKAIESTVRLARQKELAAIDALLGAHDWTARDRVGIVLSRGSALVGAATLAVHSTQRKAAAFRLRFRLLNDSVQSPAAADFASLLRFAREASARSRVNELIVENVPAEATFDGELRKQSFRPVAEAVHFEGELAAIRATVSDLARKTLARYPSIEIVPLSSCSAAEVFELSAVGLGTTGLGVRALQAGDQSAFGSFAASCGVLVQGKLRGAIVANGEDDPVFIEMLAIDGRFARLGLTVLLVDRCAERLLEAGAKRVSFNTGRGNSRMLRLAEDLKCRCTRQSHVWTAEIHFIGSEPSGV